MKSGADDYSPRGVCRSIVGHAHRAGVEATTDGGGECFAEQQLNQRFGLENIIGNTPGMQEVFELVRAVAPARTTC